MRGFLVIGDKFANFLPGGGGSDTAGYVISLATVRVGLGTAGTAPPGDSLLSIENLTAATFGDRITGSGGQRCAF